ncbi:hypothetical protein WDJ50_00145 [Deinococcus sp. VB142]|uniref:Uncharacterized protein n=1 Tax=Deinococcus sp. VB142 TaxID=3112952 RepID=A0AAU6Q2Q7_9DEIO
MSKLTFTRTALLAGLLSLSGTVLAAQDPWPQSEVLTRLFVLRPSDGEKLARDLKLSPAQVAELRRMAGSERSYGRAAAQVLGRDEAAHLNGKLATMRAEKDRKTRLTLGGSYPAFREWVRVWWNGEVSGSQSRSRFR